MNCSTSVYHDFTGEGGINVRLSIISTFFWVLVHDAGVICLPGAVEHSFSELQ